MVLTTPQTIRIANHSFQVMGCSISSYLLPVYHLSGVEFLEGRKFAGPSPLSAATTSSTEWKCWEERQYPIFLVPTAHKHQGELSVLARCSQLGRGLSLLQNLPDFPGQIFHIERFLNKPIAASSQNLSGLAVYAVAA